MLKSLKWENYIFLCPLPFMVFSAQYIFVFVETKKKKKKKKRKNTECSRVIWYLFQATKNEEDSLYKCTCINRWNDKEMFARS